MPRKATKLLLSELKKMVKRAEKDPEHSEVRADGSCPGLNAQVRDGRVIFKYRYLSPATGARRTVTIGNFPDLTLAQAQGEAADYRKKVAAGLDPQEEKAVEAAKEAEEAAAAVTVGEVVQDYLDDLLNRAKTGRGKRGRASGYATASRLLEGHVVPAIGKRLVADLKKADVQALMGSMASTPVEANRTVAALRAALYFHDEAAPNPAADVDLYRETGIRRALTAAELERLGEVLHQAEAAGEVTDPRGKRRVSVPASAVLVIRLLALTGCRPVELLGHGTKSRRAGLQGARWGDVDLDRGLLFLRDSKTGRQTRVLGAAAGELLKATKPADAEPDWCIIPGSLSPTKPLVGLGKPRAAIWRAAGIVETAEGRVDAYSLRHTFASRGSELDAGRWVGAVSYLLGHGVGAARNITERYARGANPENYRPAADAIAGELARLLGLGKPAKVLKHPAARR